jgi:hypothetical protein
MRTNSKTSMIIVAIRIIKTVVMSGSIIESYSLLFSRSQAG